MPAQTATVKIPYPLGSDPVADGDNAIRGVAETVDGLTRAATGQQHFPTIPANPFPSLDLAETADLGGIYDPATGTFTLARAGIYQCSAVVQWQNNQSGGSHRLVALCVKPSGCAFAEDCRRPSDQSRGVGVSLSVLRRFGAGDQCQFLVYQDHTAPMYGTNARIGVSLVGGL